MKDDRDAMMERSVTPWLASMISSAFGETEAEAQMPGSRSKAALYWAVNNPAARDKLDEFTNDDGVWTNADQLALAFHHYGEWLAEAIDREGD
jgi:16S rRNA C967 or C1407 C5-methylase (RsmB/RsmF family)